MAARLQLQHLTIREITGDLPDSALRQPVHPGKWSALANIAHLAAYQPVFIGRLEQINDGSSPTFGRYVAEEDPLFPGYLDRDIASLLDQITADRTRILVLFTGNGETFLTKTASHPRFGLLSTIDWTEFFLLHEAHHLYTLFSLVRDLRTPPPIR